MNYRLSICIFFFICLLQDSYMISTDVIDYHVLCSLKKMPKDKRAHHACNHRIHQATYTLKQECKRLYSNSIEKNHHYPHRRDTVFFVHFDHTSLHWTLYKPSFIAYKDFIKLIKKIYSKYGLQVTCSQDTLVTIAQKDTPLSNNDFLTLDELEKYKKMSDKELDLQIDGLQDDNKIHHLKKLKYMKKFFFWHLQIPTIGILPGGIFDIQDQYKPLAWHFLLWDLAPKKGEGAHVAIIDTGASAFNIEEKEFAHMYKKNINITGPTSLQDYGYNLVSEHGLDPIQQIAINFGHYCDHTKFDNDKLIENLPKWIIDFLKTGNRIQIEEYFAKNAKNEYLQAGKSKINEKGEVVLKDLLYGKYGIAPSGKDSFFHVVNLDNPYNQEVLLETLPTPKITNEGFSAGHGTFTQGIVNAQLDHDRGIFGLAPQAHVTMIKAFNDSGTTNKTTLNAALQRAITLKNPIVSMSLKITDEIDDVADAPLKKLIDSIDYVVAASGNDGATLTKEAYPAKFDSVAFDVGAFQYDEGKYDVCSFTQKELNIGPKFVAPGFNIFSSGLTPAQTEDSMYLFMMGTSIAVPVITGFLALVLAEFQEDFTREQILKVIYKFSMKLHDDKVWQDYIKVGTPDMRSTMLCLHVLRALYKILKHDTQYPFDNNFDNLVQAIHTMNYYIPSYYEKQINISFNNNFSNFTKSVTEKNPTPVDFTFFTPNPKDSASCINFITKSILHVINPKQYGQKILDKNKELIIELQKIILSKKFDLFAQASLPTKNRIKKVLSVKTSHA